MAAGITIKSDMRKLRKAFRRDAKAMEFAAASAINEVAFAARRAAMAQMKTKLHKPTPFTLRGVFVTKAHRSKLYADVGIRPLQWKYLKLQVIGGTRTPSGRALVMPVNQKTNQYGNLPKGAVRRHLSKRSKSGHGSTFSGTPKGRPGAKPGIYRREGTGKSRGHKGLRMEVGYRKRATYRSGRWPFFKIVAGLARNRMPKALDKAIKRELNRSARK